jgi:hypothetical protein
VDILEQLGLSEENLHWHDLAACRNIVEVFEEDGQKKIFDPMFDTYESSSPPYSIRMAVDEMCLSCPVQEICYEYGVENDQSGVWGGVYLSMGKHDRTRNEHKTKDVWKRIKARVEIV